MNDRQSRKGFSLVELLIALSIFAVAAAIFIQSVESGLKAIEATRSGKTGDEFIRFALHEILSINERSTLEEGGEFPLPDGQGRIVWEAQMEPTEIYNLFQLTIQLRLEGEAFGKETLEQSRQVLVLRENGYENDEGQQILDQLRERLTDRPAGLEQPLL